MKPDIFVKVDVEKQLETLFRPYHAQFANSLGVHVMPSHIPKLSEKYNHFLTFGFSET